MTDDPKGSAAAEERLAFALQFVDDEIAKWDGDPEGRDALKEVRAFIAGLGGDLPAVHRVYLARRRDEWLGIGGDRAVLHTIGEDGHHVQLEDDGTVAEGESDNYWAALEQALNELPRPVPA